MGAGSGVDVRENSIRITFTHDGKQEKKTLKLEGAQPMAPTSANIRHAERLVAEIKEKIRLGIYRPGDYWPDEGVSVIALTVRDQFKHWTTTKRIADSTKDGYSSAVNFWCNAQYEDDSEKNLGDLLLAHLRESHISYVLADRDELAGKTLINYLGPLREALALAVREKAMKEDVSLAVKNPKKRKPVPDPFKNEEIERVIAHLAHKHPGQVHNLVEFWAWTGLRTSEIFGLRWENVDLQSGYVRISEGLIRGKRKEGTKNGEDRDVELNSRAIAALQRQRQHTQIAGAEVFQDPRYGTEWADERAFRRSFWTPTLNALGIRYRRPYNCRHTYATYMLMADMNHSYCAIQLGHSIEMFQRTYTKWINGPANVLQMGKLEAALKAKEVSKDKVA